MKYLNLLPILFCALSAFSQEMYQASSGKISFHSDAPVEKIEAINTKAKSLLNISNNKIAVVIPVIEFKFESPLMEEHFNENYMETEKYKTASFQGVINEKIDFSKNGTYPVTATGKFSIHGVEVERTLSGTILIEKEKITIDSEFKVKLEDHKIKIPTVVVKNIAEIVDVKFHIEYEPKK